MRPELALASVNSPTLGQDQASHAAVDMGHMMAVAVALPFGEECWSAKVRGTACGQQPSTCGPHR